MGTMGRPLAALGFLTACYLGGRLTSPGVARFEYAEVVDAESQCEPGNFMGSCSDCRECPNWQYNAGGCTYFKDTNCILCEHIAHCGKVKDETGKLVSATVCSDNMDQTCTKCQDGYWDDDCKPCEVCAAGLYEAVQCSQTSDTVCAPCTKCREGEFLETACSYTSDSVCAECTYCDIGTYAEVPCQAMESVYTATSNTVCKTCSEPLEAHFVKMPCTITDDTETELCTVCQKDLSETGAVAGNCEANNKDMRTAVQQCPKCRVARDGTCRGEPDGTKSPSEDRSWCEFRCHLVEAPGGGEYIKERCESGSAAEAGSDTRCAPCARRGGDEWSLKRCRHDDTYDSVHKQCVECADGEYLHAACTPVSDALCPDCTPVDNCKRGMERCTTIDDQVCSECEAGYHGADCCYLKQLSGCGSMTTRERRADAYGYSGNSNEEFVQFCVELCDELPDCMAFEVEDGGDGFAESGDNLLGGRGAQCVFKSALTRLTADYQHDCYSNVCKQGDDFLDFSKYDEKGILDQAHALTASMER